MYRTLTISISALLFCGALQAQMAFNQVDYSDIPYKKVRAYVHDQQEQGHIEHFSQLKATCADEEDLNGFESYEKKYRIKATLDEVWKGYISASPTSAWKTRKSSVALIYDRKKDELKYAADTCNGSRIGQIVYLHMNLVKGFYHLATAIEITDIKAQNATIELSYIESGINEGKQWITMTEGQNGYVDITHVSIIKSDSKFRDRYLYPYFHNKLISAFHKNMERQIVQTKSLKKESISLLIP
jgi:hypothetical protein